MIAIHVKVLVFVSLHWRCEYFTSRYSSLVDVQYTPASGITCIVSGGALKLYSLISVLYMWSKSEVKMDIFC